MYPPVTENLFRFDAPDVQAAGEVRVDQVAADELVLNIDREAEPADPAAHLDPERLVQVGAGGARAHAVDGVGLLSPSFHQPYMAVLTIVRQALVWKSPRL
jgi:hypothetical protein